MQLFLLPMDVGTPDNPEMIESLEVVTVGPKWVYAGEHDNEAYLGSHY